ncbi:MAG: DUF357 domain-containing protein [Methanosarcinales archaeon]|uniref:DUF357 domain-containing protein n=1 Tax=Candidatus Ethanoperedens thermophilum TaxID=2766897 RepID=A0A848D9S3_9EURY|nr:DUF357 domain-containing protein [Candidatus Ethanoperedens thermophilum]
MTADIVEKVNRYCDMFSTALDDVHILPCQDSQLRAVAVDFLEMARSYYEDGTHFMNKGDLVNALVCFSYGYAWLDAGARLGIFAVSRKELFTI